MNLRLIGLFLLFAVLCIAKTSKATSYTITGLGMLPGDDQSGAAGLNASGQVVGYAEQTSVGSGSAQAVLFSGGSVLSLGAGSESYAEQINAAGSIVGFSQLTNYGFEYSNGSLTTISSPNYPYSSAYAINDHGQVVGALSSDFTQSSFIDNNGTITDLGSVLGGPNGSTAYNVNNNGDIVGIASVGSSYHAYLYKNGSATDLGALPGDVEAAGFGVNSADTVVGTSLGETGGYRSFIYQNGLMSVIALPSGYSYSTARSINDAGEVVGSLCTFNGLEDIGGYLYQNGQSVNLDSLLPANSGWTIISATGINDAGQICGTGTDPTGDTEAFLLTPIDPEPATATLLVPICFIALGRRCRWQAKGAETSSTPLE